MAHSYTVTVEVDADPDTSDLFVIGESLLGGTDVLGRSGTIGSERWVEVPSGDVYGVSVRRGRRDDTREYDAGTCVVELDNRSGDYDPDNAESVYVSAGEMLLRIGTSLRVKLTPKAGGDAATIFHGRVADFILDHGDIRPTASLVCEDWLADLGRTPIAPLPDGSASGDTTADRASWLLDAAGVPAVYRDIAGDREVLGWSGGGTARSALEQLARGEAGRCRVTRGGVVTLTVHADEYGKTPALVFTDRPSSSGYLLFDDFNRSNRVLDDPVVGSSPVAWYLFGGNPQYNGDWGVNSNRAVATISRSEHRAYWDVGATVYRLTVDVAALPSDGGIAVRSNGDGDEVLVYFQPDVLAIYTYDGANYTLRETSAGTATAVAGMSITVDVSETEVTATSSTGLTVTWSDSTYSTQTWVGVRENNAQAAAYDNIQVALPASARYSYIEVLPGSTALVNASIITRDGLDDVRAADVESVAVYGHRAVTVDVALADDDDAADLADFHANRRSQPTPVVARVDAVIARESAEVLEALALLDLGSLTQVERTTYDARPLLFAATVESLDWDLRPGRQSLSLSTSPSDTYGLYGSASWFVIGESLLGGTAVLAPY